MLKVREDGQLWFTNIQERNLRGWELCKYLWSRGYTSLPEGTIMVVEDKGMFQLGSALDLADDPCYLQSLAGSYAGVPLKEDEHISFEIGGPLIPFAMCGLPMRTDLDAYSILKTV